MNKIIEQVLEFLECDTPRIAIKEFLEDEFKAIEKEKSFIGLTDINNKKIYAESSIFEFEYTEFSFLDGRQKSKVYRLTGYFKYSKKWLSYMVYVFEKDLGEVQYCRFDDAIINSIKIIDTIQENKLGLIK